MHFETLMIWEIRLQSSYLILPLLSLSQNFIPLSPSPSTHLLLPSRSYPWLSMVVNLFLTHLLLDVASPITFPPSPFCCHWSSRSKGLHWWRRSKAYKFYMELHYLIRNISLKLFYSEKIDSRKMKIYYLTINIWKKTVTLYPILWEVGLIH